MNSRKPKLLLLAGVNGVGKTTLSMLIANHYKIKRVISTDLIREVLRSHIDLLECPELHRSSFSTGKHNHPISDWEDSSKVLENGIFSIINKSRREGVDLIIEGVHLKPNNEIIRQWEENGGIALGVILHIKEEESHEKMIISREKYTWRNTERYLSSFEKIRDIQEGILDFGRPLNWKTIDVSTEQNPVKKITHWFDLEWNRSEKYN